MNVSIGNLVAGISVAASLLATSSSARAEYKCDAPASIDRRACDAAKESPRALRSFIQRVKAIQSLYFFDYVNEAQASAWAKSESDAAGKAARVASAADNHFFNQQ